MAPFLSSLIRACRSSSISLKAVSFALVGIVNTVVDFAIFTFTYQILTLSLIASNVIAWLIAVSFSYVMNTYTTFHHETGRVLRQKDYLNFVASGIFGVVATTATLIALSLYIQVMAAKLISIFAGFIVNFTISNFVVFRHKSPRD